MLLATWQRRVLRRIVALNPQDEKTVVEAQVETSEDRDKEFAEACTDYRRVRQSWAANQGCLVSMVVGFGLGIAAAVKFDDAFFGLMLCPSLPLIFGFSYFALFDWLYFKEPWSRVENLLVGYVQEHSIWSDCSDFLHLYFRGLPHGSSCDWRLDSKTGRICLVERPYFEHLLEDSSRYRLSEAAKISNDVLQEVTLREVQELLAEIPLSGDLSLETTVHDGGPFTLEIIRGGQKRSCRGNLADIPESAKHLPEIALALKLLSLPESHHRSQAGMGSCTPDGEITIYR